MSDGWTCVCCNTGPARWEANCPNGHPFCDRCVKRGHMRGCVECNPDEEDEA